MDSWFDIVSLNVIDLYGLSITLMYVLRYLKNNLIRSWIRYILVK